MLEVDYIPHTTPDSSTWYLVLVHPDRLQGIPRYIIQEGSGKSTLVPTALVCLCTFVLSAIVFFYSVRASPPVTLFFPNGLIAPRKCPKFLHR
jgi:hypothetical protein